MEDLHYDVGLRATGIGGNEGGRAAARHGVSANTERDGSGVWEIARQAGAAGDGIEEV